MNRKFLAGAAASLMLTSLPVAITAAGAGAVKPTVTSVSVTHDANHQFLDSSTVAANETFTIVVTGTGFNNGSYTLAAKATPAITADSITKNSSTQVTIEAHTATALNLTKAPKDAKYTLTVPSGGNSGGGAVKFTTHETSNCGSTLPLAQAGKTYAVDGNGTQIINAGGTNYTGSDPAVTYFDVNVLGGPLCTGDLLGFTTPPNLTTFGYASWGINYPIDMSGSSASRLTTVKTNPDYGNGKITGVGFSFPYTTAQALQVVGSVTTYKLVGFKAVAATCSADSTNTVAIDSCVATPKGIVVTSTATRNYSQGDTIQSPVIKITGIAGKTSPLQVIPVSNVSTIHLGTGTLDITFAPRAKSANASYAPISYSAS